MTSPFPFPVFPHCSGIGALKRAPRINVSARMHANIFEVATQKAGGCDHMECNCGTHWCYFCGEAQEESEIYKHMQQVHGGYYGGRDAANAQDTDEDDDDYDTDY